MRATTSEVTNFKLADGGTSMAFERNMLDGYQRISNSIIIGESPNLGSGQWVKVYYNIILFLCIIMQCMIAKYRNIYSSIFKQEYT